MAQMFKDEAGFPDNAARANFVFLGYPFNPPLARDDYAQTASRWLMGQSPAMSCATG